MRTLLFAPALGLFSTALILGACGNDNTVDTGDTVDTGETAGSSADAGNPQALFIDSELVDCIGVGPQTCMRVRSDPGEDWTLFYDAINGFEFKPGNSYELLVTITEVPDPPADGSSLRYDLVEVVSVIPAEQ